MFTKIIPLRNGNVSKTDFQSHYNFGSLGVFGSLGEEREE